MSGTAAEWFSQSLRAQNTCQAGRTRTKKLSSSCSSRNMPLEDSPWIFPPPHHPVLWQTVFSLQGAKSEAVLDLPSACAPGPCGVCKEHGPERDRSWDAHPESWLPGTEGCLFLSPASLTCVLSMMVSLISGEFEESVNWSMKKRPVGVQSTLKRRSPPPPPAASSLCLVSRSHTSSAVFTPSPQPWTVRPASWAGGIISALVSLPRVSLSKTSSCRGDETFWTPHTRVSPRTDPSCGLFSPQGRTKLLGWVALAFLANYPKAALSLPFRLSCPALLLSPAGLPLSSRSRGFPPASLARPSLPQPSLLSSASEPRFHKRVPVTSPCHLSPLTSVLWLPHPRGKRQRVCSAFHQSVSPPDGIAPAGVITHQFCS